MKLVELARTVRSKNAGPLKLTLDLLFDDEARCNRLRWRLPPWLTSLADGKAV